MNQISKTIRYTAVLLVLACMTISGCGGEKPESVAVKFMTAVNSGDVAMAKKYSTAEAGAAVEFICGIAAMVPEEQKTEAKKVVFTVSKVDMEGDTATVYLDEKVSGDSVTVPMVKESGKWKAATK